MGWHQGLRERPSDLFQSSTYITQKGITKDTESSDHKRRINAFGDNQPILKEPKTILELILENF